MRSLTLFLLVLLAACGSDLTPLSFEQLPPTGSDPSRPPPPGGGNPGGGGGGPLPLVFDDSFIDLGAAGGFPSDLAADSQGNLFTVTDAGIPATVVGCRSDGSRSPFLSVPIGSSDLIDMDGTTPARAATTYGTGLFGAFTGDLEIAFDRWLLVTVGAGNSASEDGSGPLRLANLVVIDTQSAEIVQTVNLGWTLKQGGSLNDGAPFDRIPQSLPVMSAFVPAGDGTRKGSVFVALSNGSGTNAGLGVFYPGTVQEWTADFDASEPLSIRSAGKSADDVTHTWVTAYFNPVGLTRYTTQQGTPLLLVTSAGASQLDASYIAHPVSEAVLEVLDLGIGGWRDEWSMNLGAILPAPHRIVVGSDAFGTRFGLLTSQTFAAAYVVDLTGFETSLVNPARLGLLRAVELAPGGAVTAGSGFHPGVVLSPAGRSAVLSSFAEADLTVLSLPASIRAGPILVDPAPFDAADLASPPALGLGALASPPGAAADVYAVVNGNFDASFLPSRTARIGTLVAGGRLP